jgi:F0F1-type ATP synthase membrane subunit b/b'
MNQVLAAERQSEATLIQARTHAEVERLKAESQAQIQRAEAAAETEAERLRRQMEIESDRLAAAAQAPIFEQRQQIAELLDRHPAMLRLLELEALRDVAKNSNARVYLGMDRPNGQCIRVQD